jgi:hypothetical protein
LLPHAQAPAAVQLLAPTPQFMQAAPFAPQAAPLV